jgi:hypothetical protein
MAQLLQQLKIGCPNLRQNVDLVDGERLTQRGFGIILFKFIGGFNQLMS